MKQGSSPAIPFSMATLGVALFALMDAVMKGLAMDMGAYNAMFWRGCCSMVLVLVLYTWKRPALPAPAVIRLHLRRGVVIAATAFLFFWGLVYVPLAEAIALSFIAPLFALYLAALLLGESVGRRAVAASLIGFVGALVVVFGQFSGDYDEKVFAGMGAILMSAMLYAYNLILQRQQALLAGPVEISVFQTTVIFLVYLALAPFLAQPPAVALFPELLLAAGLSMISLMLLSWAYARAEARILIPVEYTAFIWAGLLGWMMYQEQLSSTSLLGTALIVMGCLLAASQRPARVEHVETTAL